jgi:hypothetical protein
VSHNSLQGATSSSTIETDLMRLARSELDTREPEPTQTDVTDQHG